MAMTGSLLKMKAFKSEPKYCIHKCNSKTLNKDLHTLSQTSCTKSQQTFKIGILQQKISILLKMFWVTDARPFKKWWSKWPVVSQMYPSVWALLAVRTWGAWHHCCVCRLFCISHRQCNRELNILPLYARLRTHSKPQWLHLQRGKTQKHLCMRRFAHTIETWML